MGAPKVETESFLDGVSVRLEPAPLFRRTIAAAIDMGFVSAVLYAVILVLAALVGLLAGAFYPALKTNPRLIESAAGTAAGIGVLVLIGVGLIAAMIAWHYYYIYFESRGGATPGKRVLGLRVVSLNGGPITRSQAIYRELARWYLDGLILPAALSMALNQNRRRVGDLLAGTVVVYSKSREEADSGMYVRRDEYRVLHANLAPEPPTAEVSQEYLRFAYQAFALGRGLQMGSEAQAWIPAVRAHLKRADQLGLNDQTVLRFFAELCFQSERARAASAHQRKG